SPRLCACSMQELVAGVLKLLRSRRDGFGALDVELHARLRPHAVIRPVARAEAGLCRLPQRPDAEVIGPVNLLAVQVLAVVARCQGKAEFLDEELARGVDVGADHGKAGDELHVHGATRYADGERGVELRFGATGSTPHSASRTRHFLDELSEPTTTQPSGDCLSRRR